MTSVKKEINDLLCGSNVYIKHVKNDKIYKIPSTAAIHSNLLKESIVENNDTDTYGKIKSNPMSINAVDVSTMDYIVKYMMYYNDKPEKPAPERPLTNIHLSVVFDDEFELFNNIYIENDTLVEKIMKMSVLIESAMYFDFKFLHLKLSAIIASLLKNATELEIESLKR